MERVIDTLSGGLVRSVWGNYKPSQRIFATHICYKVEGLRTNILIVVCFSYPCVLDFKEL